MYTRRSIEIVNYVRTSIGFQNVCVLPQFQAPASEIYFGAQKCEALIPAVNTAPDTDEGAICRLVSAAYSGGGGGYSSVYLRGSEWSFSVCRSFFLFLFFFVFLFPMKRKTNAKHFHYVYSVKPTRQAKPRHSTAIEHLQ